MTVFPWCVPRVRLASTAVLGALLVASPSKAQTWDLTALHSFAGLTEDQWRAAAQGEVETRILDAKHDREVAVVGLARLRASTACFLAQFRDIENFKKSPLVLQIHKLVPPVGPRDFEEFSLDARDLDDLANCRVGSCAVKLPVRAMQRLDKEVAWSGPGHDQLARSIIREELLAYLKTYLERGNPALIEYHDKSSPVPMEREFRGILKARPGLADLVPQFYEYILHYPAMELQGVSEFFYWSLESFGLKPVASVTEVSIYSQVGSSHVGQAVIASKQLYASHYFDASMGLTVALDDPSEAPHPGMYLVYLNRSRIDLLTGIFGGLRRAILHGRLREGMRNNLAEVVKKVESKCEAYP